MITLLFVGKTGFRPWRSETILNQGESFYCINPHEMTALLGKRPVDVIFCEEENIQFNPRDIFSALEKNEIWKDIPVFLVTSGMTPEKRIRALEMGAADCLDEQMATRELNALVQPHILRKKRIDGLRSAYAELIRRTTTDAATGLHTWDYLETALKEKAKNMEGLLGSFLVIRPDHLGSISETLGPQAAERTVVGIGKFLSQLSRKDDLICRLDSQAFGFFLPGLNVQQAYVIAERIRKRISGQPLSNPVTVSIGISGPSKLDPANPKRMVDEAYVALKAVSKKGVDRCEIFYPGNEDLKRRIVHLSLEKRGTSTDVPPSASVS
ncbi:MAG: diguanylate cyclase [Deltaproteobacteria bacterium]|nr:diguanylate cyclase [Deltaproteobacteria bacterium]